MVKKKSHEEGHENTTPGNHIPDNQENTDSEVEKQASAADVGSIEKEKTEADNIKQQLTEMQDKYLRLSAEFDNYRKRTLREKIELTKSAGESVILSILPVIDDFDRALVSLQGSENCSAMKDGLQLIYNKLADFLKQNGVKEMEVKNTPFDSEIHEAITNIPAADESSKGKVVDVVLKGYMLNDKVIRYPKVVVGE